MTVLMAFWTLLLGGGSTLPWMPSFAIASVRTDAPVVALTFDACATMKQDNGFDWKILEILSRDEIPTTFYLGGRWVERHPAATRAIASSPWIEIGNHTYSHPRLTLLPEDRMAMQIRSTDEILKQRLGRPVLSMRPPAGAWDEDVVRVASEEHLPVILWSVVSGDAGGHVPAPRMVRTVLEQTKPGSIVIFHINGRGPFTKDALPDIIKGLRDKGLRFVTVSQLLALPNAAPLPAKPSRLGYHKRKPTVPAEAKPQGPPT
jgi:peptidoglycan/xylan/chitin deacetylase (PgdA/CDA1 family)